MPWRIAHTIECQFDHEIVIANALPKLIPVEAAVSLVLIATAPFSE